MANPFDFSQFGFNASQFEMPDFEAIQNGNVQGQQGQGATAQGGQPGPVSSPEISNDLGGNMGSFDFGNMFGGSSGGQFSDFSKFSGFAGDDNFLSSVFSGSDSDIDVSIPETQSAQSFIQENTSQPVKPAVQPTAPQPKPTPKPVKAEPAPAPKPKPAAEPVSKPKPAPAPAPAPAAAPAAEPAEPEWKAFDQKAWSKQYDKQQSRKAGDALQKQELMSRSEWAATQKGGDPDGNRGMMGGGGRNSAYGQYRQGVLKNNEAYGKQQEQYAHNKQSAMYKAQDAHEDKYGIRAKDAPWESFDEEAFHNRFMHENKNHTLDKASWVAKHGHKQGNAEQRQMVNDNMYKKYEQKQRESFDQKYDSAKAKAQQAYTDKYGDGGEIGKLSRMVADLQSQISQNQSQGQSNDNGSSQSDRPSGTSYDQINADHFNKYYSDKDIKRKGKGGQYYREDMQANRGNMQDPYGAMEAKDRAYGSKKKKW